MCRFSEEAYNMVDARHGFRLHNEASADFKGKLARRNHHPEGTSVKNRRRALVTYTIKKLGASDHAELPAIDCSLPRGTPVVCRVRINVSLFTHAGLLAR